MNFLTLTEYYSRYRKKDLNVPKDWNDAIFSDYIFLKTKSKDLLVFKLEDSDGASTFFACTEINNNLEINNDFSMSNESIYIIEDNNELLSETREQIKVIYRLLTQHKEAKLYALEKEEISYSEIFEPFELQFIEFKDTSYSEILLSYMFYKIDTDYNKCKTEIDIEAIQNEITNIALDEQYKEHIKYICDFFSYREDEHLFISFYAYLESQVESKEIFTIDKLCSDCKKLVFCDKCKDDKFTGKNWNGVKEKLKPIKELKIDNNFILYSELKKHRNSIFHHKKERDEAWKIINDGFKECLYSMLLSILLLIKK